MSSTTHTTADVLDAHYDAARQAIRQAREAHERHSQAARATNGADRGALQAHADIAVREWERALGAAAAIEALADALGVDLEHDRRRADPR